MTPAWILCVLSIAFGVVGLVGRHVLPERMHSTRLACSLVGPLVSMVLAAIAIVFFLNP